MFFVTKLPYGRVSQREVITSDVIAVVDTEDFCIEEVSRKFCQKCKGKVFGVSDNVIEAYSNAEMIEVQLSTGAIMGKKPLFTYDGSVVTGHNVDKLPENCIVPFGTTVLSVAGNTYDNLVNSDIVSISLPPTVERIKPLFFDDCTNLETIYFSEGLEVIEGSNFRHNPKLDLSKIHLPSTLRTIGFPCFYDDIQLWREKRRGLLTVDNVAVYYSYDGNSNLSFPDYCTVLSKSAVMNIDGSMDVKTIHIGKQIKHIDADVFDNIQMFGGQIRRGAYTVTVDKDNPYYKERDGVVYDTRTMTAIVCDRRRKKIVIPNGVKHIAPCFLAYIHKVKCVVIPSSVESIGDFAFAYCSDLEEVKLSSGLKEIGESVFTHCKKLKKINIPDTVTKVGIGAFKVCHSLTDVHWSKNTPIVGDYTFRYCKSMREFIVPEGVTQIGKEVFLDCASLTSLVLPSSLVKMSKTALIGNHGNYSGKSCDNVTVTCVKGSNIEKAMQKHGIKHISI